MTLKTRLMPQSLSLPLLALLLGGATGSLTVQAQEEDPTWYQVEMIIFARPGADEGVEQWPRNIQLRYPFNWVELQDPDQLPEQDDSSDDFDENFDENRSDSQFGAADDPGEPKPRDLARDPFIELPSSERQLNAHATAINRRDAYRVLFHESWRQPVLEQQTAPAILITGGDEFGSHYELEGSISLSLARYLHLHTRLWLTEFEPNFGQPPGAWPELPRRPNEEAVFSEAPEEESWGGNWNTNRSSSWDMGLNATSSEPDFLGEDFLPNRIVTMTQQRRMRSKELHYIDHPLFGILIEITPYERPDEESGNED